MQHVRHILVRVILKVILLLIGVPTGFTISQDSDNYWQIDSPWFKAGAPELGHAAFMYIGIAWKGRKQF
jgi:hypothetical protein